MANRHEAPTHEMTPADGTAPIPAPPERVHVDNSEETETKSRAWTSGGRTYVIREEETLHTWEYHPNQDGPRVRFTPLPELNHAKRNTKKVGPPRYKGPILGRWPFNRPKRQHPDRPMQEMHVINNRNGRVHYIGRDRVPDRSPTTVPVFAIDIYDERNQLVEIRNGLVGHKALRDLAGKSTLREVTVPKSKEFKESRDTEAIKIPMNGLDKDPYSRLLNYLEEEHNITTLEGLTWERISKDKQTGKVTHHRLRITRDEVPMEQSRDDYLPTRTWVIKVYEVVRKEGRPVEKLVEYRVRRDDELEMYFNNNLKPGPEHKMRLVRPKKKAAEAEDTAAKEAQKKMLEDVISLQSEHTRRSQNETLMDRSARNAYRDLGYNMLRFFDPDATNEAIKSRKDKAKAKKEAIWLLSYVDQFVDNGDLEMRKKLQELRQKNMDDFDNLVTSDAKEGTLEYVAAKEAERRQQATMDMLEKHGLVKIVETAIKLQQEYHEHMNTLRIALPKNKKYELPSISAFVELLADEYHYANHPEAITRLQEGQKFYDPLADDNKGAQGQRKVLRHLIGQAYLSEYLKPKPDRVPDMDEDGLPRFNEENKVKDKIVWELVTDNEINKKVQHVAADKVDEITKGIHQSLNNNKTVELLLNNRIFSVKTALRLGLISSTDTLGVGTLLEQSIGK